MIMIELNSSEFWIRQGMYLVAEYEHRDDLWISVGMLTWLCVSRRKWTLPCDCAKLATSGHSKAPYLPGNIGNQSRRFSSPFQIQEKGNLTISLGTSKLQVVCWVLDWLSFQVKSCLGGLIRSSGNISPTTVLGSGNCLDSVPIIISRVINYRWVS